MTFKSPTSFRRQAGFTLIELMICITVIGILAAMAIPSYFTYVKRGRIAAAKTAANCVRTEILTTMATAETTDIPSITSLQELYDVAPACVPLPSDTSHTSWIGPPIYRWCYCEDQVNGVRIEYDCHTPEPPQCTPSTPGHPFRSYSGRNFVFDFSVGSSPGAPGSPGVPEVYPDIAIRLDSKHGVSLIAAADAGG